MWLILTIPLALERLSVTDEGKLRYALKHPYSNGTTHFLFEPLDLIAKLAALVPRPRVNLTRYHGVFAPNSKLRAQIVPGNRRKTRSQQADCSNQSRQPDSFERNEPTPLTWAQRLKRTFEFDVTVCPLCDGSLRVIADITESDLIDKILTHIKPTRAPPAQAHRRTPTADPDQLNHRIV